jgi:hypothetical protein
VKRDARDGRGPSSDKEGSDCLAVESSLLLVRGLKSRTAILGGGGVMPRAYMASCCKGERAPIWVMAR